MNICRPATSLHCLGGERVLVHWTADRCGPKCPNQTGMCWSELCCGSNRSHHDSRERPQVRHSLRYSRSTLANGFRGSITPPSRIAARRLPRLDREQVGEPSPEKQFQSIGTHSQTGMRPFSPGDVRLPCRISERPKSRCPGISPENPRWSRVLDAGRSESLGRE